jgi:integrase
MTTKRRLPEGFELRHSRGCPAGLPGDQKGDCRCTPTYVAVVFDRRTSKRKKRSFALLCEAKSWRHDALVQLGKGTLAVGTRVTVSEAAEIFIEGVEAGTIRTRGGQPYKPSVVRGYRVALRSFVVPELGSLRLSEVRRRDVQTFVDRLVGEGRSGSAIANVLMPLRAIVRRALERDELSVNPLANVRMPRPAGPRDRAASPAELAELLDALPDDLRALYATAAFAGLRRGELRGLKWGDCDLAENEIAVVRSWDDVAGPVAPKSAAGTRRVPIIPALRRTLLEHRMRSGRADDEAFVFPSPRDPYRPFTPTAILRRAGTSWKLANKKRLEAELEPLVPIGLHELRHCYVSLMHAAGVPLETIGDLVGHSSTYMTDRYRHLLDGQAQAAAEKLDAYLATPQASPQVL